MKTMIQALSALILLFSCATAPETVNDSGKPDWLTTRPAGGSAYYIGIGGSSTGDQAEDKEIARSRALAELSSEIFASVKGSLEISVTDTSEEGETYRVEQNISQKVEQSLESVETVAAWHSDEEGYWYYLRLSREEWEKIQKARADELRQRVNDMFADPFRDTLSEIKTIDRAYSEYEETFTGEKIRMDLFGQSGSIDTLLLIRAEELISHLVLQEFTFPDEVTMMRTVTMNGRVTSADRALPGAVELLLTNEAGETLGEITTAPDGTFEWVQRIQEAEGESNFRLQMVSPFTSAHLDSQLSYAYPAHSFSALVVPLLVNLRVETNLEEDHSLYERSFDVLEKMTGFSLSSAESDYQLKVAFTCRENPPNDFDIIISYGQSFVSFISEDGETVIWQSEREKDGGLTADQARGKVCDKLLNLMAEDAELKAALEEITF